MRLLPLLALLPVACTTTPQFEAKRTVDFTVPAAGIETLRCTSHNGAIVVAGDDGASEFAVRVVISVRGDTQEEADANLQLLDVDRATRDNTLELAGKIHQELPGNCSPGFAFTVTAPKRCHLDLVTHNGSLDVKGTEGRVNLMTHNGQVVADVTSAQLDVVSHNGAIALSARGSEPVNGKIESHNGAVMVTLPADIGTNVVASTSNGGIDVDGAAQIVSAGKKRVEASYGKGSGKLSVSTHNGSVRLR